MGGGGGGCGGRGEVFFFHIKTQPVCVYVSRQCERLRAAKVTFEGHFSGAGGCQGSSVSPKEPLSVIGKLSPFRGSDTARVAVVVGGLTGGN